MRAVLLALARHVGRLVYAVGLARAWLWVRGPKVRILLYHACAQREDEFVAGLSSNVRPTRFAAQMAMLARHFQVVPLRSLVDGTAPPNGVCITFDDGYRSVWSGALPVLRRHAFSATTFLVSRVIGNQELVWVNELNWMLRRYPDVVIPVVASSIRVASTSKVDDLVAFAVETLVPLERDALLNRLRSATGVDARALAAEARLYLSWSEIREMSGMGMSFGNHTASHPNLALLDAAGVQRELDEAHRTLVAALGSCESFAYPFGSVSVEARSRARALNYHTVFEVIPSGYAEDLLTLRRVVAPDGGASALFAEMEFVHPLKEWIRRTFTQSVRRATAS